MLLPDRVRYQVAVFIERPPEQTGDDGAITQRRLGRAALALGVAIESGQDCTAVFDGCLLLNWELHIAV